MLRLESFRRFEAECDRIGLLHRVSGKIEPLRGALRNVEVPATTTHVMLVAQAGGRYWNYAKSLRKNDPELDADGDPLDTLTVRTADRLRGLLGEGCAGAFFPFTPDVDFVGLGEELGAGKRSRLRILIHPQYGPWFTFRIALLLQSADPLLSHTERAGAVESPCATCSAPCIAACPAQAFRGAPGAEALNYEASFQYRAANPRTCADACEARLACPVGKEYRYPDDFIAAAHHRAYEVGMAYIGSGRPKPAPTQGRLL